MDSFLPSILSCINEGIVIMTTDRTIAYWNPFMEELTGRKQEDALGLNVDNVLPNLDKPFFHQAVDRVLGGGSPAFFSAAMHRRMISDTHKVNMKMNRVIDGEQTALLLEFIDVTNQFHRISQLRDFVRQLSRLNSELKQKEKVIEKLAYYDTLTGVANRALFEKFADKYLNLAKRTKSMLGLMFVDVNEFKLINDTYGHHMGDKIMMRVAAFLTESTRKSDIVCRYGGDEFLILLPDLQSFEDYRQIAGRIDALKKKKIIQDGHTIGLSLSIGASFYPNDGTTIEELVAKADGLMYIQKHRSRMEMKKHL
ncbi:MULTISPECIES: sensor domain-containing diguanylate cyclase [unclassified Sporolactobacillus]|uniref:sensor domain-containing diguanylate cyclase n=1 Tax=unclassified Sporolactobacillus TaxID=2628533 RepID=UPI002367C12C|nr:sensor domain-containing diguanylate cyclase [Sporolactobacillus sp. CQH2019]MDD9150355.1 diguanylate cyclase [Sporolactobacillus sp. CQH2019]